jgi:hypothetical protein
VKLLCCEDAHNLAKKMKRMMKISIAFLWITYASDYASHLVLDYDRSKNHIRTAINVKTVTKQQYQDQNQNQNEAGSNNALSQFKTRKFEYCIEEGLTPEECQA